jgi:hypothetical protein
MAALTIGFFALSWGFLVLCDRLGGFDTTMSQDVRSNK